ncbi:MAG TPA: ribbon-helix-helix domain-containing protein [Anaerolineae bacterium]|nr:ribbon-helix-helix domain-containing protein [Anaerolineae bacterium]
MLRTQIQLTEEQSRALKMLAAKQGKSVSELIRQSVDRLIQSAGAVDMADRRRRALAAAGQFRSGQTDLAVEHDRYLAEDYQAR